MYKKITLASLGFLLLASPLLTSAQTLSDLQAQIQALFARITILQVQQGIASPSSMVNYANLASAHAASAVPPQSPIVAITAPSSGTSITTTSTTITASASDSVGVTIVRFYVDGRLIGRDTTAPYSVNWDSRNKKWTAGAHVITARAYASGYRVTTSAPITVTIQASAVPPQSPIVAITAPSSGASITTTSTTITATASDNFGVSIVRFYVDGRFIGQDTTAPYSVNWGSQNIRWTAGTHVITARAYASGYRVTTSAPRTVTIKASAVPPQSPIVAITGPSSGANITTTSTTITAEASDNVGVTRVRFYVDGVLIGRDNTAPYSVDWGSRNNRWTAGAHVITARAYASGYRVTTSAPITVTIQASTVPAPDQQSSFSDNEGGGGGDGGTGTGTDGGGATGDDDGGTDGDSGDSGGTGGTGTGGTGDSDGPGGGPGSDGL